METTLSINQEKNGDTIIWYIVRGVIHSSIIWCGMFYGLHMFYLYLPRLCDKSNQPNFGYIMYYLLPLLLKSTLKTY